MTVDDVRPIGGNCPHAAHSSTRTAEQEQTTPKFLHLPYVRGVSERIERKCRRLGIRTTFKSKGTLREALVQTKDPQPEWKKKGVVYLHRRNRKNTGEEDK